MATLAKEFRYVKPKNGLIVRTPRNYAILPESGGVVPWVGPEGRYWRRRLRDGSIEIAVQPKPIKEEKIEKTNYKKFSGEKEEIDNGSDI